MPARVHILGILLSACAGSAARAEPSSLRAVSCGDCHKDQSEQLQRSVHAGAVADCSACHGGEEEYRIEPATVARYANLPTRPAASRPAGPLGFDHGPRFTGRASRRDVPARCGVCHSDVARMNPYGLPTDQVAQHRLSGHGKALYDRNNERAAVCIDCHGTHEIRHAKDPASSVYPSNVPNTCGRCHSDPQMMHGSNLSTRVVDEYRESVHGRALLEGGDVSMPHCAVCHGSHSAVPPGFNQVGHVCGRCHPKEEKMFLESPHVKFEFFPRCVGCHTRSVDLRDHRIQHIVASAKDIEKAYGQALLENPGLPIGDPALREPFLAHHSPAPIRLAGLCERCHNANRQIGHRVFFTELDRTVVQAAGEMDWLIRSAELQFAATSARVDQVGRGVLLVTEEALSRDELRTKIVELAALQHTLSLDKIKSEAGEVDALAGQINQSLDTKLKGLRQRHLALGPMWAFIVVFGAALWIKYKRLKAALVKSSHAKQEAQV